MLSPNLEQTLHRALAHANSRRHEFATLEHLLLALTEDQDALAVLRACGVDTERLRRELTEYIENELTNLTTGHIDDAKPTASFRTRAITPTRSVTEIAPRESSVLNKCEHLSTWS